MRHMPITPNQQSSTTAPRRMPSITIGVVISVSPESARTRVPPKDMMARASGKSIKGSRPNPMVKSTKSIVTIRLRKQKRCSSKPAAGSLFKAAKRPRLRQRKPALASSERRKLFWRIVRTAGLRGAQCSDWCARARRLSQRWWIGLPHSDSSRRHD